MDLTQIKQQLEKSIKSPYVIDRRLVWFYWRYRDYKIALEGVKTIEKYSCDDIFDRKFIGTRWSSLSRKLRHMGSALKSEITAIKKGEFKGVKIKNRKKDLEIRQKLLKDSEGERKELDKLELEKERKDLRIESEDLKKMQQNNPLKFKTKDPEIEELQRQSQIFLDLCLEVQKMIEESNSSSSLKNNLTK